MLLLRDKDKELLIKLISETISAPIEVRAYGSRVNGKAHDASDLDLAIYHTGALDFEELVLLNEKIRDSNIPILVEARDWNKLPESFHREILKNYEVLYSSMKHAQL